MLDRSVRDNVLFGLRVRGRKDRAPADPLLERLGLTHLADAQARRLSGGEIQRVALARAMAIEPDVLLLDEPAANLDPANVARIEAFVRDAQARDTTIVLVTHNTHEARRLAHRTLLLIEGDGRRVRADRRVLRVAGRSPHARVPGGRAGTSY